MEHFGVLDWLLENADSIDTTPLPTLADWHERYGAVHTRWKRPIDKAIAGGFLADRLAYAFVAGYQAALRRLVPDLPNNRVVALCVTEAGGGHPRAIQTRLKQTETGWILSGRKQFVTNSDEAELLLVAASTGMGEDGLNLLKMVLVEGTAVGVKMSRMDDLPFVPEVSHGYVEFDDVIVSNEAVLPGDGFTKYIKPFRTVEDIHVYAATIAYVYRVACLHNWSHELREWMLAILVTFKGLEAGDPSLPAVHIALAGTLEQIETLLADSAPHRADVDAETRERWTRDRTLMNIAGNARIHRLAKAWAHYDEMRPIENQKQM